MKPDLSINNDDFKHGEIDFPLIQSYLGLTEAKSREIAQLAASLAPKSAGKFDASMLVEQAFLLDAAARLKIDSEREIQIARMNLKTLLRLHRSLHGKMDGDYMAERDQERLIDPLARSLVARMHDVEAVRDLIRHRKNAEAEPWRVKFSKAANGKATISLSKAFEIIFPRSNTLSRDTYYVEYCMESNLPIAGCGSAFFRSIRRISESQFVDLAIELRGMYEKNKDAWIKKAQRLGGKKGGEKSASLREAAVEKEAARNLEAMPGGVSSDGARVIRPKT